MRSWEATLLKSAKAHAREAGVTDDADGNGGLAEQQQQQQQQQQSQAARLPRYVRVNTLKMTLDAAVAVLCAEGWTHVPVPTEGIPSAPPEPPLFWVDPHVPSLLVMPPETELHEHALVQSSALILQDKASCLAPAALAPRPGELILDCCAAPGNKTTQLAALSAPNGLVIACERDARRAGVLRARAAQAAGSAIRVMQIDFLSIDVKESPYCDVTAVQLDPTCSGSGMVERAGFQLAPEGGAAAVDGGQAERLAALGAMQLELVLHALSFPKARVVVYSTCSVHPVEDELVVRAALRAPAVRRAGWRLAPALPQWPCRGLPLLPDAHMLVRAGPEVCTNGFFVARFERASV
jgi:putative methyltransferase